MDTQEQTSQLWSQVLASVKESVDEQTWETWLLPIKAVRLTKDTLFLQTPDNFFRDWIKQRYLSLIVQTVQSIVNTNTMGVELIIAQQQKSPSPSGEGEKAPVQKKFQEQEKKPSQHRERPPTALKKEQPQAKNALNPRFTFENFVVGPGNRFAHAAFLAVAESPARSYNPLFIYGGVGLGKTHLMQAVGAYTLKHAAQLKVTYISSEKFTNQLISAIQHHTTAEFREKYRNVDILLIDDIHFIAGKEATQEEFFHTFNTLYDAHKQIVLSSDRPPKDIPSLEERLVSRFDWGLVTDIQPLDLETRIAILKKKIELTKINVPNEVIFFIADKVKVNIRELEGALIRVVAYSSLTKEEISLSLAHSVLKDMLLEEKRVSVDAIQRKIASHFGIRFLDMKVKRRNRAVVYPRQIAMYLTRSLTDFSLPEIGEYFGGRDHTTVLHAYEKIQRDVQRDSKLKDLLDKLTVDIKTG